MDYESLLTLRILPALIIVVFAAAYLSGRKSRRKTRSELEAFGKEINASRIHDLQNVTITGTHNGAHYKIVYRRFQRHRNSSTSSRLSIFMYFRRQSLLYRLYMIHREQWYEYGLHAPVFFRRVRTGIPGVDDNFLIRASNREKAKKILQDGRLREILLRLHVHPQSQVILTKNYIGVGTDTFVLSKETLPYVKQTLKDLGEFLSGFEFKHTHRG